MSSGDLNQVHLSELRSQYHSLDTEERFKAIQHLALEKNSDSNRELIHIFNECGWRETQFQIIKTISIFPDTRCLEFLFDLAAQKNDLPLSESAIYSLGETKSFLAARYLCDLYNHGHETLKPACVLSLGRLADRSLLNSFLVDLDKGYKEKQTLLVKNIVLALGELKASAAVSRLIEIAKNKVNRDVALSAVVSLGKITKDISVFDELEVLYKNDSFEYQIFNNAKNQCQFRSDWTLEDYLTKIMNNSVYHPALLLEFNAFSSSELKAALDLLADSKMYDKLFHVISRIESEDVPDFYEKYIDLMKLTGEDQSAQSAYLQSLKFHYIKNRDKLLQPFYDLNNDDFVTAYLFTTNEPEIVLKDILSTHSQTDIDSKIQIRNLNIIYDYLLTLKSNEKKLKICCKVIEQILLNNAILYADKKNIFARMIRILGQLQYSSAKLNQFVFSFYEDRDLQKTVFNFFENISSEYFITEFDKNSCQLEEGSLVSFLKIALSQTENIFSNKKFDKILKKIITIKKNDVRILMLKFISKFRFVQMKDYVLDLAPHADHIMQFHVILAIKSFSDETLADQLAVFLNSKSKSISGRALDALLHTPGNRSKRIVFDYLVDHCEDKAIVEKIIRDFKPPENDTDYFFVQMTKVIQILQNQKKEEDFIQLLVQFKSELMQHQKSFAQNKSLPTEADILAIDLEFQKLIPAYSYFDEASKSALRSAEVPFKHPELFDHFVDKSSIVLGYSKAIDIVLDKQLGKKILSPKLEHKLSEFQNAFHSLGLNEDYPHGERVLKLLQLEKHFTLNVLPVHKMSLIAKGFMTNKIMNDQFKILDGLRAWAVILLIFARKNMVMLKPLITVVDDETSCILLAKKLMWLQDVRNPIAHRQTVVDFKEIENIRLEVLQILKLMNRILFS